MEMMVEELKRGLEAAYQLHIELTQRLIEKQQHNNEELMASMDHHIAVILQAFQNCIARLRNPNIQHPSIPNTIPADDAECFDIGRVLLFPTIYSIRQFEPVVITTDLKEDGFKWRKYGKKPILSSKYPREYYKCRYTENGCRALKYVQMICDSPTKYRVVYSGSHTCKRLLGDSPKMLNFFCGSSKSSNLEPEQDHISFDVHTIPSWSKARKTTQKKKQPIAHYDAYSSPTSQDLMAMDQPLWPPFMSSSHGAEIDYSYLIHESIGTLPMSSYGSL